jgi:hypothetical protein
MKLLGAWGPSILLVCCPQYAVHCMVDHNVFIFQPAGKGKEEKNDRSSPQSKLKIFL